jgi:hypothetical protein
LEIYSEKALSLASSRKSLIVAIVLLAIALPRILHAQAHGHGSSGSAHTHMDGRADHGHAYYDHGTSLHGEPRGGYTVHHGGNAYLYDRSHWYHRNHGAAIVIGAPIGAFVPFLPWYYSTIWLNGLPYYYANDTYCAWNTPQDEYQVIDPPAGIESAPISAGASGGDLFIYPANGQSAEQQQRDKSDCQRAAVDQTGFDPAITANGLSADAASSKGSDYRRAEAACLDARGYSVN